MVSCAIISCSDLRLATVGWSCKMDPKIERYLLISKINMRRSCMHSAMIKSSDFHTARISSVDTNADKRELRHAMSNNARLTTIANDCFICALVWPWHDKEKNAWRNPRVLWPSKLPNPTHRCAWAHRRQWWSNLSLLVRTNADDASTDELNN